MSDQVQDRDAYRQRDQHEYYAHKHLFWGLALIAAGGIFLSDRLDLVEVDIAMLWHWWPALIALSGLSDIVFARRASQVIKGGFYIVLAIWLYACLEHLWGWTFRGTWPIILIAYGASMLLRGSFNLSKDNNQESPK